MSIQVDKTLSGYPETSALAGISDQFNKSSRGLSAKLPAVIKYSGTCGVPACIADEGKGCEI